jgi:hypothetical protein
MQKGASIIPLLLFVAIQLSFGQDKGQPNTTAEISRFDSLMNAGYKWDISGPMGSGANQEILEILAKLYPQGVTSERVSYPTLKYPKTVDRWFIVNGSSCFVYEYVRWRFTDVDVGVFGFLNGVEIRKIDDFFKLLERDIGKPVEFHD